MADREGQVDDGVSKRSWIDLSGDISIVGELVTRVCA